jgi:microcystin-dependent protein
MGLETVNGIWDLDPTWPLGTDPVSQGDDHDRITKDAILKTWPNVTEPVTATAAELNSGGMPTGALIPFGGAAAPTGYLLCDGAAVDRTTYADLYTVLLDVYGAGDGSTTFNVPDMRDRVAAGASDAATPNAAGDVAGKDVWDSADLPAHTHSTPAHTHDTEFTTRSIQSGANGRCMAEDNGGSGNATRTTENDGAGTSGSTGDEGDNRQTTLYVNYIIKT